MLSKLYLSFRRLIRNLFLKNLFLYRHFSGALIYLDSFIKSSSFLKHEFNKSQIYFCGHIFNVNKENYYLAESIIRNNSYEKATIDAIHSILKDDSTFLDLGANIGIISIIASSALGENGRIISFEPHPNTFDSLEKNIIQNNLTKIIIPEKIAITNKFGNFIFLEYADAQKNLMIHEEEDPARFGDDFLNSTTVKGMSLDDYFNGKSSKRVDLVKIDIEGQELNSLYGMEEIIDLNPDIKIIFEYNQIFMQNDINEIVNFLNKNEFSYFKILYGDQGSFNISQLNQTRLNELGKKMNFNVLVSKKPFSF